MRIKKRIVEAVEDTKKEFIKMSPEKQKEMVQKQLNEYNININVDNYDF